jgi:chromosome segregation ATPase
MCAAAATCRRRHVSGSVRGSAVVLFAALACGGNAALATARSAASCPCDDYSHSLRDDLFGADLLQASSSADRADRPRDCACITGATTYQTTPRDTLLGMGKVALGRKLESCNKKLEDVRSQRDYEVASSEAQIEKVKEQQERQNKTLEKLKETTAKERSDVNGDFKKLKKDVSDLELELSDLKTKYGKEFSAWYELNSQMTAKLGKLGGCGKCEAKNDMPIFAQRLRGGGRESSSESDPEMQESARKVEACEEESISLNDELKIAQKKSRLATLDGMSSSNQVERRTEDTKHLNKLFSKKPRIDAMKNTKDALETAVESQQSRLDKYKASNEELRSHIDALVAKLKACGCA